MDAEKTHPQDPPRNRRSNHASPLIRTLLLLLRIIILLGSLYLLGLFIFRYIRRSKSATTLTVLILSAISSAWSILSLLSTCFGHSKGASLMALVDAVHVGAMVAIAVLLRKYAGTRCGGSAAVTSKERRDCNMLRAAFGIAVGLAALYAISTLLSIFLFSAFRRGRPYGPSPDNGYNPDNNLSPSNRRGYINPDLPAHTTDPGYRHSTYTTNSTVTDTNGGSLTGRDSTNDTSGLLAPQATYGQTRHGMNRTPVAQGAPYPGRGGHNATTYEPYRAPTPVGGRTNGGGVVEMPGERDYAYEGTGNGHSRVGGAYGSAF